MYIDSFASNSQNLLTLRNEQKTPIMYIELSGKTHDTLIDLATIIGVGLAGWGNAIHIMIASIVGITLIVKNVYDILIKRQEKIKIERENNEKNLEISKTE